MKIKKLNESWGKVIGSKDIKIANAILQCDCPKKQFVRSYQTGAWDGRFKFCNYASGVFPLGLMPMLPNAQIINEGAWNKTYDPGELDFPDLHGVKLRDYQYAALDKILEHQRGILYMATGSGKTEVMAGAAKMFSTLNTCVLTHRKEILVQTAKRMSKRIGEEVGITGSGAFSIRRVTIAMVPTLFKRLNTKDVKEFLKTIDVLFIDECHHASSTTWYKLAMRMPNAFIRVGVSGTPMHRDEVDFFRLMGSTGDVIYTKRTKELVDEGFLSDAKIRIIEYKHNKDIVCHWPIEYDEGIVQNKVRNLLIIEQALQEQMKGKKVLIIVKHIEHGKTIQKLFKQVTQMKIEFTHGTRSDEDRIVMLRDFKNGTLPHNIIIASTILDEGVDVPDLDCVIMGAGGKAPIALLQRIGRGLRKAKGKKFLQVVDFMDEGKYLMRHSRKRLKVYKEEQFTIEKEKVK